ncbi:MAG TPA: acetate--CoA ligase [Patescibacteria group bacterium]|nr:acetate--CoA ligase [Patescibacteria group bacterium]
MALLNAGAEAVDKNARSWRKNKIALYWEGDDGSKSKFTFQELSMLSNQFGNLLKQYGVEREDRVFFFLPRVPELFYGFIGALKAGAIAGTLFSAFGPQALQDRLDNSDAKILITTEELKSRVDKVRKNLPSLMHIITIESEEYKKRMQEADTNLKIAQTDEEDPAFMLYTSGTTGRPKGVVHVHKAILHEQKTAKLVLDIKEEDVYWCTADPGWVTGIAYEILGTLSLGASTVVHEGRFSPDTWYRILQDYKVTVWYTAPTAIRMLAAAGDELVKKYDLSSLRHMTSVGEPLNPEPIKWGKRVFGLYFYDTYWQTETGGMMIANRPGLNIKPGSMGKPLPGIEAAIADDKGNILGIKKPGNLVFKKGWDSMMRKIWRRPEKYASYFKRGWYYTGDQAYKDEDGYFWFVGRADDVIKTSGERVGPFEVESALVSHPSVVEAGVIGKPDPMRGEIIKAFVTLKKGVPQSEKLKEELAQHVKKFLAGHAYPREIEFMDKLPKTRSGKIMRRILKAQELGLPIGDTSTLEEY